MTYTKHIVHCFISTSNGYTEVGTYTSGNPISDQNEMINDEKGYVQNPHKGGSELIQPTLDEWEFMDTVTIENITINNEDKPQKSNLLKLIRKIWQS
jgi:hypothetical protein